MGKKVDLTGQRFGRLVVLRDSGERLGGEVAWECQCDCGNVKNIRGYSLRCGDSRSCGLNCFLKDRIDLSGQRFGKLVVLRDTKKRLGVKAGSGGTRIWECQCDCGKIVEVRQDSLRCNRRSVISCGCIGNRTIDLIGKKFGMLTVVKKSKKRSWSNVMWECICDCGNRVVVIGTSLRTGKTKSCGCVNRKYLKFKEKWNSRKEAQAYKRKLIVDSYVKGILKNRYHLPYGKITKEMIQLKREQIKMFRELKKAKEKANGAT